VEKLIAQRLAAFGDDAPDLARRLTRMVGRSKHPGHDARSSFTKETLVAALRADGFAEDKLIAAGVVRANPIDDAVWDWYRDQVVHRFRSFRVYGLQVDRDVYADLPALFVPLRLVPIRADRPIYNKGMRARTGRSLAERLSAEVERLPEDADDRDKHRHPDKGDALDLAGVLAEKRRLPSSAVRESVRPPRSNGWRLHRLCQAMKGSGFDILSGCLRIPSFRSTCAFGSSPNVYMHEISPALRGELAWCPTS